MESTIAVESKIAELIVRTLVELSEQGIVDLDGTETGTSTELFGQDGLLDSVGLVSLVVAVEQQLEDELGLQVSLADERALSQRGSPYRSVCSLAAYAASLVPAG